MINTNINLKELASAQSNIYRYKVILDMSELYKYELPLTSQHYIDGRLCQFGLTNFDGETVHLLDKYDHHKYYDRAIFYCQSLEDIHILISDINRSFNLTAESSDILVEKLFDDGCVPTEYLYLNIYAILGIDPDEEDTFRVKLAIGDAQDAYGISTFYSRE